MDPYEELVTKARRIATTAHKGQTRPFTKEDYINHPHRVSQAVEDDVAKAVAWLHDTIEDKHLTENDLRKEGIPEDVIIAVKIVSRNKEDGENYFDFIFRIKESENAIAMLVKLADLRDNMSDLEECGWKDKYRFAEYILAEQLGEMGYNV